MSGERYFSFGVREKERVSICNLISYLSSIRYPNNFVARQVCLTLLLIHFTEEEVKSWIPVKDIFLLQKYEDLSTGKGWFVYILYYTSFPWLFLQHMHLMLSQLRSRSCRGGNRSCVDLFPCDVHGVLKLQSYLMIGPVSISSC